MGKIKLYYVETNAYDMIVADFVDYRRVHVIDERPVSIENLLSDIAEDPFNLSGDDYYDMTAEDLIGNATVLAET